MIYQPCLLFGSFLPSFKDVVGRGGGSVWDDYDDRWMKMWPWWGRGTWLWIGSYYYGWVSKCVFKARLPLRVKTGHYYLPLFTLSIFYHGSVFPFSENDLVAVTFSRVTNWVSEKVSVTCQEDAGSQEELAPQVEKRILILQIYSSYFCTSLPKNLEPLRTETDRDRQKTETNRDKKRDKPRENWLSSPIFFSTPKK